MFLLVLGSLKGAELPIPSLTLGTNTYFNVSIKKRNDIEAIVRFDGGLTMVKLRDLPEPYRGQLFDAKKESNAVAAAQLQTELSKAKRIEWIGDVPVPSATQYDGNPEERKAYLDYYCTGFREGFASDPLQACHWVQVSPFPPSPYLRAKNDGLQDGIFAGLDYMRRKQAQKANFELLRKNSRRNSHPP